MRRFLSGIVASGIVVFVGIIGHPGSAVADGEGTISGKVYVHSYVDATADSTITKRTAIDLTRAYLGYKYKINDNFLTSLTLDVERVNEITAVVIDTLKIRDTIVVGRDTVVSVNLVPKQSKKTVKDERYEVFLKTAFLEWKGLIPTTTLTLGMIGGIQFDVQEKFWGYRYVYKSFMDEYKMGQSADLGIVAKIKAIDLLQINVSVTQGEGFKKPQDINGIFKPGLGVQIDPVKGLTAYLYGDYMMVETAGSDSASIITLAGFVGYEIKDKFKIGAEYNYQMNQGGYDSCDVSGVSGYGNYTLVKEFEIFARADAFMSANNWNLAATGVGIVGGVQYSPHKSVKLAADYQGFIPDLATAISKHKIFLNVEFSL